MANNAIDLNDENFKDYIASDKPVLVDFWAEWCGPCKMLTPIIEELAEEYADRAVIAKVNVDQASSIAQQYSIRSIPALLFFKNGAVEQQLVGAVPKEDITKIIDGLL
tara:strand:+ start:514 stop:837 length:324 start_codon:yes stop_codon:yes gene_type:complete